MAIRVGVPRETLPGERRVAMVPEVARKLTAAGVELLLEHGAGTGAYYPDAAYEGASLVDAGEALAADVVLKVQPPTAEEIGRMREGALLIGFLAPHRDPERIRALCARKVTALAMELVPRISRAQSMDALSSQAAVAGYKAALLAADHSPRFFPMLTTAAGTIRPATVLVLGAGVAGLQAIATARRLGAVVEAYDVRSATREQVESLGARFVDTGVKAEGAGGYARELTDEEKAQQQQVLADHVAQAHCVITTAAIPGRAAPRLISREMAEAMRPGTVIIDLAAEGGGNCELTRPGEVVEHGGVTIHGPLNVPSMLPVDASAMYARNLYNLLGLMIRDGELAPDWEDEILAGSTLTRDGSIRHAPTRERVEGAEK